MIELYEQRSIGREDSMHKKARRRKLTIGTNKITMISRKYDEVHINKSGMGGTIYKMKKQNPQNQISTK